MTRWHGVIGFVMTEESPEGSGIWKDAVTEREYSGQQDSFKRNWDSSSNLNENISINSVISVIADPFLYKNIGFARYVNIMGIDWRISMIENQYPRINITVGGIYNAN